MKNINFLKEKSKFFRRILFEKFILLSEGHPGSIFSILDILVCLYYCNFVKFNKNKKLFSNKVIISKGHATSALYPILNDFGVIEKSDWNNWGKNKKTNLRIFGNNSIPGIDVVSGSLGHGVGIGVGLAYSYKRDNVKKKVYVVISEGELYEGSTWESLLLASNYKLDNLVVIIDINSLIILGKTEDNVKLESIKDKILSFNFSVSKCNGHNFKEIIKSLRRNKKKMPHCILAYTIKGKGFSIMENKPQWHYWNKLSKDQIDQCLEEIR